MGLLDDAIREHLDLKRRRGADPGEVERAEREALGPVRRAPERAPGDERPEADVAEHGDLTAAPVARDDDPFEPAHDEVAGSFADRDAPEAEEGDDWSYDTGAEPPAAAVPAPHPAEPLAAEPLPPEPPRAEPERHGYADHTVEYDVEEALGGEPGWEDEPAAENPAQAGEDVLEETPEFLQDTPDHDRLWFEQRPPRDFDFDK